MYDIIDIPSYGKVQCSQMKRASFSSAKQVRHYIGIPFAQPPVGKLRFLPPEKSLPWNGILCNKSQDKIPVQILDGFEEYFQFSPRKRDFYEEQMNEDCLYLNVFVPENSSLSKLPVLVWFYGGSFQNGPRFYFDGTALAGMNNIIVVAPNYRVNTFGFMSLGKNTPCKGNLGLLDQLQSLKWVKECIGCFGGDENNVTISGNSAGGISVHMHMLSPLSQGYFHKAIGFSGTAAMERTFIKDQSKATNKFLEILNIKETDPNLILKQLQGLSTKEIADANIQLLKAKYAWFPTLDNHFLMEPPIPLISRGQFSKVPYMFGVNNSEGGWLMNADVPSYLQGCSKEDFYSHCKSMLKWFNKKIKPEKALPLLLQIYNNKEGNKSEMYYSNGVGGILADSYFMSGVPKVAKAHTESGSPTYCYHYTHAPRYSHDDNYGPPQARKPSSVGADHADEVYFVWGAPFLPQSINHGFRYSENEKKLSQNFMTYISNFVKSGDPNRGASVDHHWPNYTLKERRHLVLDIPIKTDCNLAVEACYLYYDILPKL